MLKAKKLQIWGMYNWNLFQDPHGWRYCNGKKSPLELTGVPLMHNLVDPNHKEFLALPPNLVYHTVLHIVMQHQNPMLLSPGCMQDAWAPYSMAWSWFWTCEPHQYRHCHDAAGLCHRMYPDVCTWPLYRALEICGSNSWHWLCYKI